MTERIVGLSSLVEKYKNTSLAESFRLLAKMEDREAAQAVANHLLIEWFRANNYLDTAQALDELWKRYL